MASFEVPYDVTCHGFAGYFECVLYKDILMSIHPETHSKDMFSWFSIFFPLEKAMEFSAGDQICAHMWRLSDEHSVWYEWAISSPRTCNIHNPAGRSYKIGL